MFIFKLIDSLKRKSILSTLANNKNVSIGKAFKIGTNNQFTIYNQIKKLLIGNQVSFRNFTHILVATNAELQIQDHVFFNNNCSVNCMEKIIIGEKTMFGENVKLYDHNHKIEVENGQKTVKIQDFTTAPIYIGKNCWLGSNVTILKGVTIGDNSIIGAGCVIFKDVPPNTTVINKQDLLYSTN